MAQTQTENTPDKSAQYPNPLMRSVRCTSNGGETSTVVDFSKYGISNVIGAVAYSVTGAAQIVAANVVLTAKATVTVTHTANHTIVVEATGTKQDVEV